MTLCLGHGAAYAQADQANEAASTASAAQDSRSESNGRAVRSGNANNINGNNGNGATVEKVDGAPANVITPGNGRAVVSTPNRGAASGAENPGRFRNPNGRASPNAR